MQFENLHVSSATRPVPSEMLCRFVALPRFICRDLLCFMLAKCAVNERDDPYLVDHARHWTGRLAERWRRA